MASALLLEFIAAGQFQRGVILPFVHGFLRSRDVSSRWLRFGLKAARKTGDGGPGFEWDGQDRDALMAAIRSSPPTHILVNRKPFGTLLEDLRALKPGPLVGFIADWNEAGALPEGSPRVQGTRAVFSDVASVENFFDLSSQEGTKSARIRPLMDEVTPDFSWEPGNEAARTEFPLPVLLCGNECNYHRGLSRNPMYEGIDLSSCPRSDGCSFCASPPTLLEWRNSPKDLMLRQLEALRRTHPKWNDRPVIRAVGEPFLRNVEAFADVLGRVRFSPSDFLFDGRVDNVASSRRSLKSALEMLRGSGHTIHLFLIGIENFSPVELERLNKGVTWHDNMALIRMLFELERDYPREFSFRKLGDLSLILYTPWTSLQDLALNLSILRRSGLSSLCKKVFTSRLRLYDILPIHRLALRDGLLVDQYEDRWLDTARKNFYSDEIPWRFKEPVLEPLSRLFARFGHDAPEEDPLRVALKEFENRFPLARDRMELAETLVDVATAYPDITDPQDLLDRTGAAWEHPSVPESKPPASKDLDVSDVYLWGFDAGQKPVLRIELSHSVELPTRGRALEEIAPVILDRGRPAEQSSRDVFLGRTREEVEEAIRLTEILERTPPDQVQPEFIQQMGIQLGYPECCSKAYSIQLPSLQRNYRWLQIVSRLAREGEVSPLLNPGFDLLGYVPCTLGCQKSLDNAVSLFQYVEERFGKPYSDDLSRRLQNPWLLLVDLQDQAVELQTSTDPRSSFRYRAGIVKGTHPLVTRIAEGDELIIEEHQLTVLRKGRLHSALAARGYLWWHTALIQQTFWTELVDLMVAASQAVPGSGPGSAREPKTRRDVSTRLARFFQSFADKLSRHDFQFNGYRVQAVKAHSKHRVQVDLMSGGDRIVVFIETMHRETKAFVSAGPLAIYHPENRPIDTPEKAEVVRLFAKAVEMFLKMRMP